MQIFSDIEIAKENYCRKVNQRVKVVWFDVKTNSEMLQEMKRSRS